MKRKITKAAALLLCFALVMLSLTGCGKGEAEEGPYTASAVDSEYSMADEVEKFLEAVDTQYGYDLAYKLSYDDELWDNELGWRTAGSDAEHRAADVIAEEMKAIGLEDVEKVGTECDKFQFNDASLAVAGTDIEVMPASYQCSGTDGDLTAEIVDCGAGTEADYEGKDVEGKIALVGVDQVNESWIDNYILQAAEEGAAALVTYSVDGYGRAGDDSVNVQDICTGDIIPTVAISKQDADKIIEAVSEGKNSAVLNVDVDFEVGGGTTYNVMGTIKGKSSENRIILSGHYDKYWYGFQDDSAAIGLVFAIAKAMKDSGYVPENDIVVVAHGAEEWGVSDSVFDWTMGAWGMIEKQKDWQGTTLAMLNCELPAFRTSDNTVAAGCVPEFRTIVSKLVNETGLVVTSGDVAMERNSFDSSTMEDGVTYRWHGVPYFINMFEDEDWLHANYHTSYDNADTYDEDTFRTNINWMGALAIYIDQTPALELDLTQVADDIEANLNESIDAEAGTDIEEYKACIDTLRTAAASVNEQAAQINEEYEKAAAAGDDDEMAELREQGRKLNSKTLAAFAAVQPAFCRVDDFAAYYGHPNMTANVEYIDGTIEGLENGVLWGEEEDGAMDYAWQINSALDYNWMLFSKGVAEEGLDHYDPDTMDAEKSLWGYQRTVDILRVGDATYELSRMDDIEGVDTEKYIEIYKNAREEALGYILEYCNSEMKAMKEIASMLN